MLYEGLTETLSGLRLRARVIFISTPDAGSAESTGTEVKHRRVINPVTRTGTILHVDGEQLQLSREAGRTEVNIEVGAFGGIRA